MGSDADSDDVATADGREHLADVPEGAGCMEIWEHLSEQREESDE